MPTKQQHTTETMKHIKSFMTVAAVGIALLSAMQSSAQVTRPVADRPAAVIEKPVRPERPERPVRPERPEGPLLVMREEVRNFIEESKEARAEFLRKQTELLKEARGASEEQREEIRAKVKENRSEFLDSQRDAREDVRKHLAELRDKLREHRDAMDDAKDSARRRRDGDN